VTRATPDQLVPPDQPDLKASREFKASLARRGSRATRAIQATPDLKAFKVLLVRQAHKVQRVAAVVAELPRAFTKASLLLDVQAQALQSALVRLAALDGQAAPPAPPTVAPHPLVPVAGPEPLARFAAGTFCQSALDAANRREDAAKAYAAAAVASDVPSPDAHLVSKGLVPRVDFREGFACAGWHQRPRSTPPAYSQLTCLIPIMRRHGATSSPRPPR
jgi:hypothetical protein